jgi:hypothetical protein
MPTEEKQQTNIRLTPSARAYLQAISELWGIAQGDVVEILLKAEAARIGINSTLPADIVPPWPSASEQARGRL